MKLIKRSLDSLHSLEMGDTSFHIWFELIKFNKIINSKKIEHINKIRTSAIK